MGLAMVRLMDPGTRAVEIMMGNGADLLMKLKVNQGDDQNFSGRNVPGREADVHRSLLDRGPQSRSSRAGGEVGSRLSVVDEMVRKEPTVCR